MPKKPEHSRELTKRLCGEIAFGMAKCEKEDTDYVRCNRCTAKIFMDYYLTSKDIPQYCNICSLVMRYE